MPPSDCLSATTATGSSTRPVSPSSWSAASPKPCRSVMTSSICSIEMLRSLIHALVSATYASSARTPLMRPRTGWCSSGSPANDPTRASNSPAMMPSKNGTVSTSCPSFSCSRSSTGAENCSGAHGMRLASHIPPCSDLQPRLLQVELAQDAVHPLVRQVAVAAHPHERVALRAEDELHHLLVGDRAVLVAVVLDLPGARRQAALAVLVHGAHALDRLVAGPLLLGERVELLERGLGGHEP